MINSRVRVITILKYITFGHGISKDQKLEPSESCHSNPGIISSSPNVWQISKSIISFTPMHCSMPAHRLTQDNGKTSLWVTFCIIVDDAYALLYRQALRSIGHMPASSSCGRMNWISTAKKTQMHPICGLWTIYSLTTAAKQHCY